MRIQLAAVVGLLGGALATTAGGAPPVTGSIRPVARMSTPRAAQTETALSDGTVLVAGGCTNPGCELGSPRTRTRSPARAA